MQAQHIEWTWLDARETISLAELARACGLSADELDELVDYGALAPLADARPQRVFSAAWVVPLRTVSKLRADFDLDLFAAGMLLGYLQRIDALERELASAHALAPKLTGT